MTSEFILEKTLYSGSAVNDHDRAWFLADKGYEDIPKVFTKLIKLKPYFPSVELCFIHDACCHFLQQSPSSVMQDVIK